MISFVTGKPGDGKSLFATLMITKDLIETEVFVVTNIPLNMVTLNAYVTAKRGPNGRPFVLDDRIKVIPDAEVYEFYRHRSGGLVLPWSSDHEAGEDGTKRTSRQEFVAEMKGNFWQIKGDVAFQKPVHFYIDEAHNFFSSREWGKNGRGTLYYASQHRHLWDNVFLITQVMDNVEKQLRSLVSETHAVRNQLRRRIGPIRMRPVFRVSGYYGVPNGTIKPFAVTTFALDLKGVAACYQTVGALGVHSAPEAKTNKAPLPWWVLPVGGVLLVLLVLVSLAGLPFLGMRAGAGVVKGTLLPSGKAAAAAVAGGQSGAASSVVPASAPVAASKDDTIWVKGWVMRGRKITVVLSDGRSFTEGDSELERVQRNLVVISGKKYFVKNSVDSLPVAATPPSAQPAPADASPTVVDVTPADDGDRRWDKESGSWKLKNPPIPMMPENVGSAAPSRFP